MPLIGKGLGSLLTGLYGSKPATPDPTTTAGQAIQGNLANLKGAGSLAMGADTISAAGAKLPFDMNLPNYENMLSTATGNVSNELAGQLSPDVIRQIQQGAAERGVAGGQGAGSPNDSAAYLRALGLTSLGLQETGQQDFSRLMQETPTGESYDVSKMFVSPSDQQAAQEAANKMAAAPDPIASGLMNTFLSI